MDGGGLWSFLMSGREGTICMYNRKTTSSGLDTIICGAIDDLFSAPSRILQLNKSLNLESKNVLRCKPPLPSLHHIIIIVVMEVSTCFIDDVVHTFVCVSVLFVQFSCKF
jgi:hypothetical protein